MDLAPRHRIPFTLPSSWPACVGPSWIPGAAWLCSADRGESLLSLPGVPLTTRWQGGAWVSAVGTRDIPLPPWEALEAQVRAGTSPWIGAATFELACDAAGLPRKPLTAGTLGQHWAPVLEALHLQGDQAELWSWSNLPPDPAAWRARLAGGQRRSVALVTLEAAWTEAQHRAAVESIQTQILEGAFYVANLCVPFQGTCSTPPFDLACAAFEKAQPPFGAWIDLGEVQLVSLSMERVLSRRGDRLRSQPIKGSAPLSGNPTVDRRVAAALAADPKERAEHTMIVDLVRNDLGRVAQTGTVHLSDLMSPEPYPTIQHLVSTVEATARGGLGLADLLRAVLPGGSVTGAPKLAVCRHLAEAEAAPRGFYCGAVGWVSPGGDLDLALPIRTAQLQGHDLTYWAGGGITRRSEPTREWAELLLKTRTITG